MAEKDLFFKSKKNEGTYFKWRLKRSSKFVSYIEKEVSIKNKKILDVGCGQGALSYILTKEKAKAFAVDNSEKALKEAKKLCKGVNFIKSKSEKLPYRDNFFDMVVLFYVLEHVNNLKDTLKECKRVLKKGGYLCIEFPPYYSLTGHHLYRFTLLPMQYLPKKLVKWYILRNQKEIKQKSLKDVPTSPLMAWETFETLNKITIKRFKKLTRNMKTLKEKFIFKYPGIFLLNIKPLKYIPIIREIFTLSYFAILKKVS